VKFCLKVEEAFIICKSQLASLIQSQIYHSTLICKSGVYPG